MRQLAFASFVSALTCCLFSPRLFADPPTITHLIPSGGQRGTTVEAKLVGKPGDGEFRVISGNDAIVFTLNEARDAVSIVISETARPGVHWLRFCNPSGTTELKPFIVGLIPETTESEPNSKLSEANAVELPSVTVNGVLDKSGEVDTYSVTLSKGQTLVAAMQANKILNSPMDAVLQILDERGTVVAQNDDDVSFDPRLAYTAPSDGKWFVRTFAFPAAPNSTIAFAGGADYVYRLTLTTAGVVEHTEPALRFEQDNETPLTVFGWNIESPSAVIQREEAVLSGPYALPFSVPRCNMPSIVKSRVAADRVLSLPVAVTGRVTSASDVAFEFDATKGQKLSMTVRAQQLGSLLDPVLVVTDAEGKVIKEADDISGGNHDAELHLTMSAAGRYRVLVRDRFQQFSNRHFFVLTCEETKPSFEPTIASTTGALKPDTPLEIPVTINRKHGFTDPVDIRVEGLPEGVTFECPRSEKDGESSKSVKVKITGKATEFFQGPIRIIAQALESTQTLPVQFSTADNAAIVDYWLTVPKP